MKTNIYFRSYLAHFFLEWKMFHTNVLGKLETNVSCSITFFFENRGVYEIKWITTVERSRLQMTIWRMRIACWIAKDTKTHTSYVTRVARTLLNIKLYLYRLSSCFSDGKLYSLSRDLRNFLTVTDKGLLIQNKR